MANNHVAENTGLPEVTTTSSQLPQNIPESVVPQIVDVGSTDKSTRSGKYSLDGYRVRLEFGLTFSCLIYMMGVWVLRYTFQYVPLKPFLLLSQTTGAYFAIRMLEVVFLAAVICACVPISSIYTGGQRLWYCTFMMVMSFVSLASRPQWMIVSSCSICVIGIPLVIWIEKRLKADAAMRQEWTRKLEEQDRKLKAPPSLDSDAKIDWDSQ